VETARHGKISANSADTIAASGTGIDRRATILHADLYHRQFTHVA
jgi:hypothetical protein